MSKMTDEEFKKAFAAALKAVLEYGPIFYKPKKKKRVVRQKFKHEFHHKFTVPVNCPVTGYPIDGNTIHTAVYRWNDCDNEGMLEYVERLVLSGDISVNSELFSYVAKVCKSWRL